MLLFWVLGLGTFGVSRLAFEVVRVGYRLAHPPLQHRVGYRVQDAGCRV